jgi:hypothetical protein
MFSNWGGSTGGGSGCGAAGSTAAGSGDGAAGSTAAGSGDANSGVGSGAGGDCGDRELLELSAQSSEKFPDPHTSAIAEAGGAAAR